MRGRREASDLFFFASDFFPGFFFFGCVVCAFDLPSISLFLWHEYICVFLQMVSTLKRTWYFSRVPLFSADDHRRYASRRSSHGTQRGRCCSPFFFAFHRFSLLHFFSFLFLKCYLCAFDLTFFFAFLFFTRVFFFAIWSSVDGAWDGE